MTPLQVPTRQLLEPLRQIGEGAPESGISKTAREKRMVAAILKEAARPRYPRWAGPAIAAGTTLALAAGLLLYIGDRPPSGEPRTASGALVSAFQGRVIRVGSDGKNGPIQGGQTLFLQDQLLVAAGAMASLKLGSGAVASLSERTEIALATGRATPQLEQITLKTGRISLEVPHLEAGHSLAITTPHARIRVIGTRFSVAVVPASAPGARHSCVTVDRGVVEVTGAGFVRRLTAGQQWSSDGEPCVKSDSAAPPASSALPARSAAVPPPASAIRPQVSAAPVAPAAPALSATASPTAPTESPEGQHSGGAPPTAGFDVSTLERQNQLFKQAMDARRLGDKAQALRLLDQLVAEHPESPLGAQARRAAATMRHEASQ